MNVRKWRRGLFWLTDQDKVLGYHTRLDALAPLRVSILI